jgi:hypothetical protein
MISLKTFHIFFIFLSILLCACYGYYEIKNPSISGIFSMILGIGSLCLSGGLIVYGMRMIKKFRTL